MNTTQIAGKVGQGIGNPQPVEIGTHGDAFPEPKAFLSLAGTVTYTGKIKYLYGHGTSAAEVSLGFDDSTGLGTVTGLDIVGIDPTFGKTVTITSGSGVTVY